ncbi:MAG: DUF177 domain-containing protein [Thalassobaculaceae bacterium]
MTEPATPVLLDPVPLERIGAKVITLYFDAGAAERAALAERFGLLELSAFTAEATLRRRKDIGWIELKGRLHATVVQECVVTLEPVVNTVEGEIDELFDDSAAQRTGDRRDANERIEVDLDPVADEPEPLDAETLDVGEIVAQVLSLSIEPYPRAPGVADGDGAHGTAAAGQDGQGNGEPSPFAALALLKDRHVKKR